MDESINEEVNPDVTEPDLGNENPDTPVVEEITTENSILNSIKKLLGIEPDYVQFDLDIITHINAALTTLWQLGSVETESILITNKDDSYETVFGEDKELITLVKPYLLYRVRLAFDPPSSSAVMECMKELLRETEWRISVYLDAREESEDEKHDENTEDF